MSQSDLNIANQGFPAFRADLNDALVALGSTNSGATAPATTFANQLWYDTANNILKIRNEDNDAWISLLTLNQTADTVSEIATAIATLGAGSASNPALTTAGDANTGIFFPAADTIAFAEGGVEVMRINSSGQVGIGTNNPVVPLQVGASSDVGIALSNSSSVTSGNRGTISMFNSGTSSVGYIRFGAVTDNVGTDIQFGTRPAAGSLTERMRIDSAGNVMVGTTSIDAGYKLSVVGGGIIALKNESGTAFHTTNSVNADYSVTTTSGGLTNVGTTGNALAFTTGSERMRIANDGIIFVGTTASVGPAQFVVKATGNQSSFAAWNNAGTSGFFNLMSFPNNANNAIIGTIQRVNDNTITYGSTSDYRLKENITPMNGALDKVSKLKPVTYKWKSDGSNGQGFIAHELQEVVPDCVTGIKDATQIIKYEITPAIDATYDEEGNELTPAVEAVIGEKEVPLYQGVDTSFLVATLTAAIQELKAEVDTLKAQINKAA